MSDPRGDNGVKFTKGNKHGKGRPKLTKEERELRKMTKTEALNLLSKHCFTPYKELKKEIKNKDDKECLDLLVMRVIESAIAKADLGKLNWIFDKIIDEPKRIKVDFQDNLYSRVMSDIHGKDFDEETMDE